MAKKPLTPFINTATLNDTLLATKLYIPQHRPDLVARPRLVQQLYKSLNSKLTLISAAAGFGKTTLLSEWLTELQQQATQCTTVGWVSLDENDNDPPLFFTYLITALQRAYPDAGDVALALLRTPQAPSLDSILTTLINSLLDVQEHIVLILDDYHLIKNQVIHNALLFFLEHAPSHIHLVIASRSEPPFPLSRLRASGQLIELHTQDLRFTLEEVTTFVHQSMPHNLSATDIATMEHLTEGWITGLQLMALSIDGHHDISAYLSSFTGTQRYILDYMVEEILHRQPEHIQAFFLYTSILQRFTASLCNAVTAQTDSQSMLDRVERANLFLIPLDDQKRWYRYHHLFSEVMYHRLQQLEPEQITELHLRASQWYEENNLLPEAIEHALKGKHFNRATRLITRISDMLLKRSEINNILQWIAALPAEHLNSNAQLCLYHTWALFFTRQYDMAEQRLHYMQQSFVDDKDMAGDIAALGATIANIRLDAARSIQQARFALQHLPADNLTQRGLAYQNLGIGYSLSDNGEAAVEALNEARKLSTAAENTYSMLATNRYLGQQLTLLGQLHEAATVYRTTLQFAEQWPIRIPTAGIIYVRLAEILYEWNKFDEALSHLHEGITRGQQEEHQDVLASGKVLLARIAYARGDTQAARDTLSQVESLLQQPQLSPLILCAVGAYQARLSLLLGNLHAATTWAHSRGLYRIENPLHLREVEFLTLARILIHQKQYEEAHQLLNKLLAQGEKGKRTGSIIEILILQALTHQAQQRQSQAQKNLSRALSLAEPAGYIRLFVDEYQPMSDLLTALALQLERKKSGKAASKISLSYIRTLQETLRKEAPLHTDPLPSPPTAGDVALLSEREQEILQEIAQGASNQQIAEKLVITIGTVKWHLNHIYSKLGVSSRTQALLRARQLHLLQ